jgi:hypothetical protein
MPPSLNFPQLDFVKPSSGFHPVTWVRVKPTDTATLITSYPTDLAIVLTIYPTNLATLLITYPTNLTIRFRVETQIN